ncbi:uncharacterized protein LOC132942481 [Metopolophium dirhodum]|uniref:uncharacterized protein LOC132942481 n=1 Tax=Metopolophium dirhodum TaxID=44670 RepID=UPI00298FDD80|nr:uncharacterized protein LOC132942481 [Metopolophium dirhodum]XP_060866883.1 uncharacterized protein LOC132942481 [Metopolophium dirhodum]
MPVNCIMLSYMAPSVSDKPPTVPSRLTLEHKSSTTTAYHRFNRPTPSVVAFNVQQLDGHQPREGFGALPAPPVRRTMVKEDSTGSIASSVIIDAVLPATHESKRPATKPAASKRVSFGSSKGSMVETLIYDSPSVQEETLDISDIDDSDGTVASTKVRVSFFESEKPCVLPSPPKSLEIFGDSTMTTSSPILQRSNGHVQTQISSDGWDNPFRPDGDLSKEADQIVELIKEGKPITPTPTSATSPLLPADHSGADVKLHDQQQPVTSTPTKANGTCNEKNAVPPNVEVQRGTVINGNEPSQVEHVILKKKPKCRCCVIQ